MATKTAAPKKSDRLILQLPVREVHPDPRNRDVTDDDVKSMMESIKDKGQLTPIVVRFCEDVPDGHHKIIFGERRWRAALKLKLKTVDAEVRQDVDAAEALKLMAIENGEREDLNPIQKARMIEQLGKPVAQGGSGLKRVDAAKLVGLESGGAASNLVRLLELPEWIQAMIVSGEIPQTYGREFLKLPKEIYESCGEEFEKAFRKEAKRRLDQQTKEYDWPLRSEFYGEVIHCSLNQFVRFMDDAWFEPGDDLASLQVVSVPSDWANETEEVALNTKLFDKLQTDHSEKRTKVAQYIAAKKTEPTKAELRERKRKQAEQLKRRLSDWKTNWHRRWLANEIDVCLRDSVLKPHLAAIAVRVILCAIADTTANHKVFSVVRLVARNQKTKLPSTQYLDSWKLFGPLLTADGCTESTMHIAAELLWPDRPEKDWVDLPQKFIASVIKECKEFKPHEAWDELNSSTDAASRDFIERFFSIHSNDQLGAMLRQWNLDHALETVKTKSAKIRLILDSKVTVPESLKK